MTNVNYRPSGGCVIHRAEVDVTPWLSATVEASERAIVGVSCDGTVVVWNAAAELVYGHGAEEIVGRSLKELLPPGRGAEVDDLLAGVAAGDPVAPFELQCVRKDGTPIDVSFSTAPVRGPDGAALGAAIAVQNVTAARELELERRHAQKLDGLATLAGGVAHDFNNLLTVILGCGSIALDPASPEDGREAVEEIVRAANRAGDLTRQLLAFSRQEPAVKRRLDLNRTLDDLRPVLARAIPSSVELDVVLDPGVEPVLGDPSQIEQLVMNLVLNARDAMPLGGRLTIATRTVLLGEETAHAYAGLAPGAYSMLLVSDTGIGMAPETQAQAFEPFFTTKPPGVGTGLGLPTVRRIVEQSKGRVTVSSEAGVGTVCTVYLPCAGLAEEVIEQGNGGSGETILVVEDDDGLRRLATTVLRLNGYRVIGARDRREAIEAVTAHAGVIKLVLSDVDLPGMSGPELVEQLECAGLRAPIVFMSGHRADEIDWRGLGTTRGALLDKPFTPDMLLERVGGALGTVRRVA
jgi:PAS domain S-box-containing protein